MRVTRQRSLRRQTAWHTRLIGVLAVCAGLSLTGCDGILSPEVFQARTEQHGGSIDFVFGDERPFDRCHASTLVQAPTGELLCAWFGGTGEGNDDVAIWLSVLESGTWTPPQRLAKVAEVAHWNPVLFRDGNDQVHLFFKVGENTQSWQTYWMHRQPDATWTAPEMLVPGDEGGRGPVKNKPIMLRDGTWLAPASTEQAAPWGEVWRPFTDRSTDGGQTWRRSEDFALEDGLHGRGAIQPTLWTSSGGGVHAMMRSQGGAIWRADSADDGLTWSPMYATDLPNNNSGIDLVQLSDGLLVLAFNPIRAPFGFRNELALTVSEDNGTTWTRIARLAFDPNPFAEFSYPSIIGTDDGIAVSHTWNRTQIRCWQIPHSALLS